MKGLSPETLLALLGVDYNEKTNRLSMLCPWHDDTDPSSGFYLDTQRFFCFSCELTLDLVGFYAKFKEVPRADAERELTKEFGGIPAKRVVDRVALARRQAKAEAQLLALRGAASRKHHAFLGEQLDRALLFFERGHLSEEELDKVLRIWYNKVKEACDGTDPRRTPGIGLDGGLTQGVGDLSRTDSGAGVVDLD